MSPSVWSVKNRSLWHVSSKDWWGLTLYPKINFQLTCLKHAQIHGMTVGHVSFRRTCIALHSVYMYSSVHVHWFWRIPWGSDQQKKSHPLEFDRTLWHRDGTLDSLDWNSRSNYVYILRHVQGIFDTHFKGQSRTFRQGEFCDIFRTLGRTFGPNFGFPYMFYTFSLLPQLKIGRSQPA